ncbi:MAG: 16S rRNA (guanine(966)-N(2))-methyltransferase RsmD [Planctomycetota bacterium]|jgi:16S rRNA (guanine966-N2)-methyltransferase
MRIIAGEHRGRRLQAPPGMGTRPMLDRVREAVFSSLAPWVPEARVLDLFAGSGALGLEALSRGAAHARFAEANQKVASLIQSNVDELGLSDRADVLCGDALEPLFWYPEGADLVFCDPPYPLVRSAESRKVLMAYLGRLLTEGLADEGVVVLHVPRDEDVEADLPPSERARKDYGTTTLWLLQAPEDSD